LTSEHKIKIIFYFYNKEVLHYNNRHGYKVTEKEEEAAGMVLV